MIDAGVSEGTPPLLDERQTVRPPSGRTRTRNLGRRSLGRVAPGARAREGRRLLRRRGGRGRRLEGARAGARRGAGAQRGRGRDGEGTRLKTSPAKSSSCVFLS